MAETSLSTLPQSKLSEFIFRSKYLSWVWLIVRVYVGWQWLHAGWTKLHSTAWVGDQAGTAVQGFLLGALQKSSGPHPDVQSWYAAFINNFALEHTVLFSYMVTYGELLVGAALILGICTAVSAFFGAFMNVNYLLAGTVSINPILLVLEILLMLAWRTAGFVGADRYILSKLYARTNRV